MNEIKFERRTIGSVYDPRLAFCGGVIRDHQIRPSNNRCANCGRDTMEIATETMFEVTDTIDTATGRILFRDTFA